MALYASASPRELSADAVALATPEAVPAPVKRTKPNARPEGDAQDAILEFLKDHPNVRAITRINRGVMQGENTFVRFNTTYGKQNGMYMRIGDLQAVHWPSGRLIAIEVKAPGWKRPSERREHEQAAYLECVREAGGIAGFATSVDEVRSLLDAA